MSLVTDSTSTFLSQTTYALIEAITEYTKVGLLCGRALRVCPGWACCLPARGPSSGSRARSHRVKYCVPELYDSVSSPDCITSECFVRAFVVKCKDLNSPVH